MLKLALLGALALAPMTARAQGVGTPGASLGTTPQRVVVNGSVGGWSQYYFLFNADTANTVWCSRTTANPQPHVHGSFSLAPGGYQEFRVGGFLPVNSDTWCRAETGTAELTVELH